MIGTRFVFGRGRACVFILAPVYVARSIPSIYRVFAMSSRLAIVGRRLIQCKI
jgi:hypothetical protein